MITLDKKQFKKEIIWNDTSLSALCKIAFKCFLE